MRAKSNVGVSIVDRIGQRDGQLLFTGLLSLACPLFWMAIFQILTFNETTFFTQWFNVFLKICLFLKKKI